MSNEGKFLKETTIYVSTLSKLNLEQTQSVTDQLLRIIGYANCYSAFNFRFIDENDLIQAHASVDSELRVSIKN
ncbi:MAG TPA: hypothetical protein VIM16_20070 [Mucilaginibacter sp.]|jgi:hypothetical protein